MIAPLRQLLRYHHDQRLYADLVHARKSLLRGQDCKQPIICQPSKADPKAATSSSFSQRKHHKRFQFDMNEDSPTHKA
jgi:hypothetical protein